MYGRSVRASRAIRVLTLTAFVLLTVPVGAPVAIANGVAETRWVDAVSGDDGNLGTEEEPFKTITHALLVADYDDTIMVEPGTYDEANGETFPLVVTGETLKSTAGAASTSIVGDGTSRLLGGQDFMSGDEIRGFTFRNGGAANGAALNLYLNMTTDPDTPVISDNVFEDNEAASVDQAGGAITMFATFMAPDTAKPLLQGNTFQRNVANDGGAVMVSGPVSATFIGNSFVDNEAESGGALSFITDRGSAYIDGNDFHSNNATSNDGGAIYMSLTGGGTQIVKNNDFMENSAFRDGGALFLYGADVALSGSDAGGNDAGMAGGFLWAQYTSVYSENNVVGGHSAGDTGNAWYLTEAYAEMRNDTIVDGWGSSTTIFAEETAELHVSNSILWSEDAQSDIVGATSLRYSCVHDTDVGSLAKRNSVGPGVMSDDPMFFGEFDGRLRVGSPCIDSAEASTSADQDFYGTSRPQDGDGDGNAAPDMGCFEHPPLELGSLAGADRYATAVDIAMATFDGADTAVIAGGANFPDALSAAGLASAYDAPLLLTKPDMVPSVVASALADLGVSDVLIVGGTAAVWGTVETTLEGDYTVRRIAGIDRYQTAAMVAEEIAMREGTAFGKLAFIARGDSFPDALAVSPLAYHTTAPILLTRPGALPTYTSDALTDLDIETAVVAGGTGAVSGDVKTDVDALLVANGGAVSDRWFGADRYATAREIAEAGVLEGYATWDYVGIATGANYPDALAGGAATGANGGVVLLTNPGALSVPTREVLEANADTVLYVNVFGGTAAVSDAVRDEIADALGW